jgi:long-chain acyl-CoA synthetase
MPAPDQPFDSRPFPDSASRTKAPDELDDVADGTLTRPREDTSLVHCFNRRVDASGSRVALRYERDGVWCDLSWRQWQEQARCFATALVVLGVQPGQRVAILANTRLEWAIADIGSAMAGAVTTAIYAASTASQAAFIVRDCTVSVVICEDSSQVAKIVASRELLPSLTRVVCMDGSADREDGWVLSWQELMKLGQNRLSELAMSIDDRVAALTPQSLATLAYTSGTSGTPKGVRISHGNLMYTSAVSVEPLGITAADTQLIFLPLAHIMGRTLLACAYHAGCVSVLQPNPQAFLQSCQETGVSFFCAVPRVLERLFAAFEHQAPEHMQAMLGGKLRFVLSGGARLPRVIADFFRARGVPVYEGYGLTESAGTLTVNLPGHWRHGSVGRVARGTELCLAADGEVLAAGPGIMAGYHERPAEDEDAIHIERGKRWLRTGDIGRIDDAGYLWITDRKKDIFKLSNGKYIAPALLETLAKAQSNLISQVVIYGENRAYVTALCTLNLTTLTTFGTQLGVIDTEELSHHPEVQQRVDEAIAAANEQLAPFERIRRTGVVYPDFALESGELTATLKVRRQAIIDKHRALLESLYEPRRH